MVGFERLCAHGWLPASAHLEWPFLNDGHRRLAHALHTWLDEQTAGSSADWASAVRAAGWPERATDARGRAVLAEALAAHHDGAMPVAQALCGAAARLGLARRIAREWRLAVPPGSDHASPALQARWGRLEAALDAAALGVYRAAWQTDRHANDAAIDEVANELADLMVEALLTDLLAALGTPATPAASGWRAALQQATGGTDGQRAQRLAQEVGRWRLQHP